jgi:hypothetical protein
MAAGSARSCDVGQLTSDRQLYLCRQGTPGKNPAAGSVTGLAMMKTSAPVRTRANNRVAERRATVRSDQKKILT